MTQYHAFHEAEAIAFARNIKNLFTTDAELVCREIGDGNLNLVFHIQDRTSHKSVILKQALPYAKVVGESWPLTLDRARIESEALILQATLCPGLVPHVFEYVPHLALTVMEDLSDHVIMRRGLMACNRYPLFAEHISTFLAHTLFFTSDLGMNQQEKKLHVKQFINPELCKITEDLIFDHPYTNADTNNFHSDLQADVETIWKDNSLHLEVARLRQGFLTHAQALLHGDLHTGSIFVTAQSTKVIDPEFAYYGPMGFDIGAIFANLLLNFAGQEHWSNTAEERQNYRDYLLATIQQIWTRFNKEFRSLWNTHLVDRIANTPGYQDIYMQQILQDSIGYAGCKMIRRIIGLAHVADIDKIPDAASKLRAERIALSIGKQLILQHRSITAIEQVLEFVKRKELIS